MKKTVPTIGMIACFIVAIFFGYKAWNLHVEYQKADHEYQKIKKMKKKKERSIDFERLHKINPDIVAWIEVPGTNIDYPVVQGKNNEEYMHHTFRKNYNFAGCIFLDSHCHQDFSSDNSVIYGHHMRNGTMFAQLVKFREDSFVKKHRRIILYLPGETRKLNVVSAYAGPATSVPIDFGNQKDQQRFYQRILAKSTIPSRKIKKHLYTFVTCSYERNGNRTYVYATEE